MHQSIEHRIITSQQIYETDMSIPSVLGVTFLYISP